VLATAVPVGLLTHGSLNRAVSLGFYILGAFLVVIGFAGGTRGPFRSAAEDHEPVRLGRRLRRATLEELNETMNIAAIVVVIGVVLLVIGVVVDSRYTLF
jgi:sulfite exporter TauE/SafE